MLTLPEDDSFGAVVIKNRALNRFEWICSPKTGIDAG